MCLQAFFGSSATLVPSIGIARPRFRGALFLILLALASPSLLAANGAISVTGATILRDGVPWQAKGVVIAAFAPPDAGTKDAYAKARARFGIPALDKIRAYGADVIRMHVNQDELDPENKRRSKTYKEKYVSAVRLARSRGFNVIVNMVKWSPEDGMDDPDRGLPYLPSEVTVRAWRQLAPIFKDDSGVMFEVFNEPGLKQNTSANWSKLKKATQPVIDAIRSSGAKNAIIVEGVRNAHYLSEEFILNDPERKLIYGVHPFINKDARDRASWERDWGFMSKKVPIMVTAFNATASRKGCRPELPSLARQMLDYLEEKKIGYVLWAFDLAVLINPVTDAPTDYVNFKCGVGTPKGIGALGKEYFKRRH